MPESTELTISKADALQQSETPKRENYAHHEIYVLRYKDRSLVAETHFGMKSVGDSKANRQAAIKRGMLYCDRMRFRFIHCEPFLTDLDENEAKMGNI